jgi:hypothetical protein
MQSFIASLRVALTTIAVCVVGYVAVILVCSLPPRHSERLADHQC